MNFDYVVSSFLLKTLGVLVLRIEKEGLWTFTLIDAVRCLFGLPNGTLIISLLGFDKSMSKSFELDMPLLEYVGVLDPNLSIGN